MESSAREGEPQASTPESWPVGSCTVDLTNIAGKGAYGVVFTGKSPEGKKIAAKKIDCEESKMSRISKDLDKLKSLKHKNIVEVIDVQWGQNLIWILMDFCSFGDLNKFFCKKDIPLNKKLAIMSGIAQGVEYLHRQDIIHRDIKPGNILVQNDNPICIKLTDFDVSKFLDAEIETSVMTSNVGTNAFKAPEFFMRNELKKISYHRCVDVYAAGLTFLAIIQHSEEHKMLKPHIETSNDHSELHAPVGQLIAERIKYKVKELNIVVFNKNCRNDEETTMNEVRSLIQKMTCVDPTERLQAFGVCHHISKIEQRESFKRLKLDADHKEQEQDDGENRTPPPEVEPICSTDVSQRESFKRLKLDHKEEDHDDENRTPPPEVEPMCSGSTDEKCPTINGEESKAGMEVYSMCIGNGNELFLYGKVDGEPVVKEIEGIKSSVMSSQCSHDCCQLNVTPYLLEGHSSILWGSFNSVLKLCKVCDEIVVYNFELGNHDLILEKSGLSTMATGPGGSLLYRAFYGVTYQIPELATLSGESSTWKILPSAVVDDMCFVTYRDVLVLISRGDRGIIHAVNWEDKSVLWEFEGEVEGQNIDPIRVCSDGFDRIFVADCAGNRIVAFNTSNGSLMCTFKFGPAIMKELCWWNDQGRLVVCYQVKGTDYIMRFVPNSEGGDMLIQ